ncbi:P-II family nitrogen regulator [Candidatus Methylacidiphilum infernorum]|uniref:Nitrogen regulatory protein PII n=1 Tax=Methylacidiphilum infernorum (isolate V4) TaxID=481448 RepID=B3DUY2_METI4|nr:P-II family nitrogen regulator [Candidatus Methylacidiphilum infernorum]ACD83135.1 Nitrogen regulatory protein PII [Methylacidiphilum infernorum V4]
MDSFFKIEAIVKPFKLGEIRKNLCTEDILAMSIYRVKGLDEEENRIEKYRGDEYFPVLKTHYKIEIFVQKINLSKTLSALRRSMTNDKHSSSQVSIIAVASVQQLSSYDYPTSYSKPRLTPAFLLF